jgi:hypothetical protein
MMNFVIDFTLKLILVISPTNYSKGVVVNSNARATTISTYIARRIYQSSFMQYHSIILRVAEMKISFFF